MASLVDIHAAIRTQLETISGLQAFDFPAQGTNPPAAFVTLNEWTPRTMSRNTLVMFQFSVIVVTAESARPQDGYRRLLRFVDPTSETSVFHAIWDGNAASEFVGLSQTVASVSRFELLGQQQVDALQMYGGEFTVDVHTQEA